MNDYGSFRGKKVLLPGPATYLPTSPNPFIRGDHTEAEHVNDERAPFDWQKYMDEMDEPEGEPAWETPADLGRLSMESHMNEHRRAAGLPEIPWMTGRQKREARRAAFDAARRKESDAYQRYYEAFYRSGDYTLTKRQRENWFAEREPRLKALEAAGAEVLAAAGFESDAA